MPDPSVQQPDPSTTTTPTSLAAQYAMAQALRAQGLGPIQGEPGNVAVSPFQVFGGLAQQYVGNRKLQQTAQQEVAARAAARENAMPIAAGEPDQQPPGPLGMQPPKIGGVDPMSRYAAATASLESGGQVNPYASVGPMTRTGDHAYGKYQVMGSNIPQWTKDVLGIPLTPQEFLQNPGAQEAVYRTKFGQLVQKYGPEGAAKAWFAGEGGMNNPQAADVNGMTVGEYGQNFTRALNFTGEPADTAPPQGALSTPPPGTPGSPVSAFRAPSLGSPGPGANLPSPSAVAPARSGVPIAGATPLVPRVSRQQFIAGSNPNLDEADKAAATGMYYGQNQPISVPGMGGNWVLGQGGRGAAYFVPTLQNQEIKAGSVSVPRNWYLGPDGQQHIITPTPQGSAAPQGTAAPAQTGAPEPQGRPPDLVPSKPLPFAPEGAGQAPGQAGLPDIITKGPQDVQGALAAPPPYSFAAQPTPTGAAVPGAPGGEQTAQAAPDLDSMSPGQLANWAQQYDVQTQAAKDFNSKDIDNYNKDYANYQTIGQKAINATQSIALAQQLIHDPRFIQGPGADYKLFVEKAKSFFGDQGATAALALNQAFDKTVAGNILGDMRAQLQGLGQVRLAEINLLNRAAASTYNTIGANQAILDLAQKSQQQLAQIGKLTNYYRQGYRWDDDGKLITDDKGQPVISNDRPTSAGQNQIIRTFLIHNPMLSDKEIDNYNQLFDADKKPGAAPGALGAAPPSGAGTPAPPPGFIKKPAAPAQPAQQ